MNKLLSTKLAERFSDRFHDTTAIHISRAAQPEDFDAPCITVLDGVITRANSSARMLMNSKVTGKSLRELFDAAAFAKLAQGMDRLANAPVMLLHDIPLMRHVSADVFLMRQQCNVLMLMSPYRAMPTCTTEPGRGQPFERRDSLLENTIHELRSAINATCSAIKLADSSAQSADNFSALYNLERMRRLIDALFDSSLAVPPLERIDPGFKLGNVCKSLRPFAQGRNVSLAYSVPMEKLVLSTYADKLERLAVSLILNAINITPEYGCVLVTLHSRGDVLVLRVQNTCQCAIPHPLSANRDAVLAAQYARELGTHIEAEFTYQSGYAFSVDIPTSFTDLPNMSHIA